MSEFVDYLHEVFESFGPIRSRKMFGGHGIYHNDLMFGLVADDELYLKTDSTNVALFEELGLGPFEFVANNKTSKMSYYLAPEEIYDDPEQAAYWAEQGFQAALRAQSIKLKRAANRKPKKRVNKKLKK
ncbi:MAG: TfoX/Sxy family protein [Arenicella sp.]|nr:TfoX/Sxy family protein [Arenicella sp.]